MTGVESVVALVLSVLAVGYLLALEACTWEPGEHGGLPRLGRHGALEDTHLVAWGEFVLPTGGVEVPVRGRGRDFGRLVLLRPSRDARVARKPPGCRRPRRRTRHNVGGFLGAFLRGEKRP